MNDNYKIPYEKIKLIEIGVEGFISNNWICHKTVHGIHMSMIIYAPLGQYRLSKNISWNHYNFADIIKLESKYTHTLFLDSTLYPDLTLQRKVCFGCVCVC